MVVKFDNKIILSEEKNDKILYSAYLFILIFAPPIVPYPHIFLSIFSFFSLIRMYPDKALRILKESGMYNWGLSMIILAIYTLCIPLLVSIFLGDIVNTSHYISIINRYGVLIFTTLICTTYLLCKVGKKYDYVFLIECLINAGLIEGFCSILAFLSPAVKTIFIFFMKKFSESYLYSNTWYITVRSYGFASTLVDVFGLGIGIIAGISFFYGLKYKKRYIIYSIIIAIATVLNSRTGLLIYGIAIIISLILIVKTGSIKKIIIMLASFSFLSLSGIELIQALESNEYTLKWLQSGMFSITDFFSKKSYNYGDDAMSLLFQSKFWQLPTFPRILIGTGHSLYLAEGYRHSDVGYINEIWLFGLIGCSVLYGKIILLCKKLVFCPNGYIAKYAGIFLFISYFFFNIKGAVLGYNPGAMTIFFIVFILIYYSKHSFKIQKGKQSNETK